MDFGARLQAELDELAARIGHDLTIDDPHGRLIAYMPRQPPISVRRP